MAENDKNGSPGSEERVAETRARMRARLEEIKKNPKTWFELRLVLNVPVLGMRGQKEFCISNARMALHPSEELGLAIQAMPPVLHEVALKPELREELEKVAEDAAKELREHVVAHDEMLQTIVRKLIVEYMTNQWNSVAGKLDKSDN